MRELHRFWTNTGLHTPLIHALLAPCRPSCVPRLVVAVIVRAVECEFPAWPRANVQKEQTEGSQPPLTHLNAAPAVVLPPRILWIGAALLNPDPNSILSRPTRYGRVPVCSNAVAEFFPSQAPARLSMPVQQVRLSHDAIHAARAAHPEIPVLPCLQRFDFFNDLKAAESPADHPKRIQSPPRELTASFRAMFCFRMTRLRKHRRADTADTHPAIIHLRGWINRVTDFLRTS